VGRIAAARRVGTSEPAISKTAWARRYAPLPSLRTVAETDPATPTYLPHRHGASISCAAGPSPTKIYFAWGCSSQNAHP
jgi:hypothetical protein